MMRAVGASRAGRRAPLTHGIHPYAAKFSHVLPRAILEEFGASGQTVLDPFVGSGTTLVEACVRGLAAVGVDIHPLAVLLSRVKTLELSGRHASAARKIAEWAAEVRESLSGDHLFSPKQFSSLPCDIPEFDNRDHWFYKPAQRELGWIRARILTVRDPVVRDFLWVAFSVAVLKASRQDSETRYAALDRPFVPGSALETFRARVEQMLQAAEDFKRSLPGPARSTVYEGDIRKPDTLPAALRVELVVTSPPYANTYDYYLYHKHRMNWIGLDYRRAQDREIGSRMEFSSQKAPVSKFRADMLAAFGTVARHLKRGGLCIVVQGDSRIAGVVHSGEILIREIGEQVGLSVREVRSTEQSKSSKLFNPAFAVKGKREHIVVLERR